MNVPALVQATLGDEEVAAHVPLKGEDAVFVTATRTLRYTAEGLLSDEDVEEYSHDAEGIAVSEGRRKAKISLDYGTDGTETFAVPRSTLDDVLHPVVAGVLNAAGVTGPGETVKRTFRFSELTLVVTSARVVKHVGEAVWSTEFEEINFDAVTGLDVEEGSVSSQLVLETAERNQRIKAPNEQFRAVREAVEEAVFAYHDAADADEFAAMNVEAETESATEAVSFGEGVDPIDTSGVGEDDASEAAESAGEQAQPAGGTASTDAGGQSATETGTQNDPSASASDSAGQQAQTVQGGARQASSQQGGAQKGGAQQGSAQQASAQQGAETQTGEESGDEFASSGFETAASKLEHPVDPAELDAELDEMEAVVAELAENIERQREVIDAQQEALDAQQEALEAQQKRLAELRSLTPDQ
jgi:hypothetical protein